ncbi:MAG: sigma-70 family RNA polymerase sigma factor [Candidatus Zixiibacteriota bacterium]
MKRQTPINLFLARSVLLSEISNVASVDHGKTDELVEKARRGDRQAFSDLVRKNMNAVVALTYRMTGNRDSAHDLAQESFVSAWENLAKFRGDSKFESWLYRIAINKCLNFLESRKAAPLDSIQDEQIMAPDYGSPEKALAREELRQDVLAFMNELPPQQRAVFELRFYRQMSFEEISNATDRALGTVKTNYREAVAKLREYAEKRGWRP